MSVILLLFCGAPDSSGSEITPGENATESGTEPAPESSQIVETQEQAAQEPNLRINVEGNRRWCVRMREPIWPKTRVTRPPGQRQRRGPVLTTFGYAYYVYAEVDRGPEAEESDSAVDAAADDDEEPESAAEPQGEEAEPVQATASAPNLRPALRAEGGISSGSWLLVESGVTRPLKTQRRPQRGQQNPRQQPQLIVTWDNSRSCTMFPTHIEATLPPGRYALQANFDVLFKGRGWVRSHQARLEGVEIEEGRITEVQMQVSTDGYVEVKPQGRVAVFFPPPIRPAQEPAAVETDEPSTAGGD